MYPGPLLGSGRRVGQRASCRVMVVANGAGGNDQVTQKCPKLSTIEGLAEAQMDLHHRTKDTDAIAQENQMTCTKNVVNHSKHVQRCKRVLPLSMPALTLYA